MIETTAVLTKMPLAMNPGLAHAGISGLFAAAVVSQSFCKMLLSDPELALEQGYMGKSFGLSAEDASLIVSLNAKSLPDLARQVVRTLGA
jgi:hypothetical protein